MIEMYALLFNLMDIKSIHDSCVQVCCMKQPFLFGISFFHSSMCVNRFNLFSVSSANICIIFQATEKQMHQLAVEPPKLLDRYERRVQYSNKNGRCCIASVLYGS